MPPPPLHAHHRTAAATAAAATTATTTAANATTNAANATFTTSSTITTSTRRKAIPRLGLDVPKAQLSADRLNQLFDEWDPDKSGRLSLAELVKKLRRCAAASEREWLELPWASTCTPGMERRPRALSLPHAPPCAVVAMRGAPLCSRVPRERSKRRARPRSPCARASRGAARRW